MRVIDLRGLANHFRLDALVTALLTGPRRERRVGAGQVRARKRLAQKRKANMAIPDRTSPMTRQERRRYGILLSKQAMTEAKKAVMKKSIKGGAAIVPSWRQFIGEAMRRAAV